MGRPRHKYQSCKVCGISRETAGHITATGKCLPCAAAIQLDNIRQLQAHSGPRFSYWRERIAASVGAVLLDDL